MATDPVNNFPPLMTKDDFVYSRIGMALTSAQRVEFITGKLLEHLLEFDKTIYRLTSAEFFEKSAKSKNAFKTLGEIFRLLKLNPKLVIEDELNEYLQKRNLFVHKFWVTYLTPTSDENDKQALDFCYDFGRHSQRIESFFKGFLYFLSLRHVEDRSKLTGSIKYLDTDFEYFMISLHEKRLEEIKK